LEPADDGRTAAPVPGRREPGVARPHRTRGVLDQRRRQRRGARRHGARRRQGVYGGRPPRHTARARVPAARRHPAVRAEAAARELIALRSLLTKPLVLRKPLRDVALNPFVPLVELTAQGDLLPLPLRHLRPPVATVPGEHFQNKRAIASLPLVHESMLTS